MALADKFRTASSLPLDLLPAASPVLLALRQYSPVVFMLHRVLPEGGACYDPEMAISAGLFDSFLTWVGKQFEVVPVDELPRARSLRRRCALTFDDGWLDNYQHAWPLLRRHGLPATIYLPLNFIGTDRHFWQERIWHCRENAPGNFAAAVLDVCARLPWMGQIREEQISLAELRRRLLRRSSAEAEDFAARLEEVLGTPRFAERAFMNWEEIEEMRAGGVGFGSHTLEHCLLPNCPPAQAARELAESHRQLRARWSGSCGLAYPWGATNPLIRDLARQAGYRNAVTTQPGTVTTAADPWALPRVAVSSSVARGLTAAFSPSKMSLQPGRAPVGRGLTAASPRKIRIAFVMDGLGAWEGIPGGYLGGSELQLLGIIRALDLNYFEPELYLIQRGGAEAGFPDLPIFLLQAEDAPRPPGRLELLNRLVGLMSQRQPDIVQGCFRDGMIYGIAAARVARVPVIVSSRRNAGYWIGGRDRLVLASLNRCVDSFQVNARTVAESLISGEGIPAERIEILPNALDLERFQAPTPEQKLQVRRELGVDGDGPFVVAVANLRTVKRLDTLLRAAALALPQLPGLGVWLIGEGGERAALEAEVGQLGLSARVRFWGKQADVRPWLAAADVAVLPSASEGASNAVLEYLAMGLPALLSDIPANREVGMGMFFPVGDEQKLAELLLELCQNPQKMAEMARNGRKWVQQFSPDQMAQRVQAYYCRLFAVSR